MQKRSLVIANWKMYIESPEVARAWVAKVGRAKKDAEVWAAVPAPFIPLFAKSALSVGAQTVSRLDAAHHAHTGEVSATMVKNSGASFTLVGHSERRAAGDTNEAVHAQFAAALKAGLTVVLCVGEQARSQDGAHFTYIEEQLRSAFAGAQSLAKKVAVAYEPVWAIGKSAEHAMKPPQIEETVIFIRKVLAEVLGRTAALKVPVLYGGSVEPANAHALRYEGGVGGFLIGHASASPEEFLEIVKQCKG
ncbi:MAG: triose-phosphate isomerase family protein [Patescibacteria group bacterium]